MAVIAGILTAYFSLKTVYFYSGGPWVIACVLTGIVTAYPWALFDLFVHHAWENLIFLIALVGVGWPLYREGKRLWNSGR